MLNLTQKNILALFVGRSYVYGVAPPFGLEMYIYTLTPNFFSRYRDFLLRNCYMRTIEFYFDGIKIDINLN